eukprot:TRINITY_DN4893_c0_g2_i1.p1 TRINITY_DN4893_c0_g2~~TRINITY_DN4893_c0_g2_i1.p1  ORF type:complete len:313 (+),score=35.45 TRINITY_DN4893_c0_g2_i1:30-941(+)
MDFRTYEEVLQVLPPMPAPLRAKCTQNVMGCFYVLSAIALHVGLTHIGANFLEDASGDNLDFWLPQVFAFAEASVALICLVAIMLADPGELKRSESRCLPVPSEMAQWLENRSPEGLQADSSIKGNIEQDGRTYCVRCCLWRDQENQASGRYHHCSICQRCVPHFDHHCMVLGKCIAGQGCKGNIGYFRTLVSMQWMGLLTSYTTLTVGLFRSDDWKFWLGVASLTILGIYICSFCSVFILSIFFRWRFQSSQEELWKQASERHQGKEDTMASEDIKVSENTDNSADKNDAAVDPQMIPPSAD